MSEKDLAGLCATIEPEMMGPVYVYCSFADFMLPDGLPALCTFREVEGLTAVIDLRDAERCALPYTFKARLITLKVHSSLDAVGFLAVVSAHLTKARIPCNAIAGYYHDHILVPVDRADEALAVLVEIRHSSVSLLLE
ncbi:ACT domain-containing protein [Paraburkholderia sp. Ac-20336]|uniref:ACT domain-containing protein n=1 Tax=Paraburkholderia sp. Ac-20336 TaxID=2703886 RepID=UPI00197F1BE1|nr:ACT domain-containing protein [Paraburkholderia sp. Ac-20336]